MRDFTHARLRKKMNISQLEKLWHKTKRRTTKKENSVKKISESELMWSVVITVQNVAKKENKVIFHITNNAAIKKVSIIQDARTHLLVRGEGKSARAFEDLFSSHSPQGMFD